MTNDAKKTNAPERIRNCRQLRRAIAEGCYEFRLLLCGGAAFSSKHITTDVRGRFRVFNYIDDSVQRLSGRQLYTESNIGNAMENGAFVKEGF
jgi:hypothetical protein